MIKNTFVYLIRFCLAFLGSTLIIYSAKATELPIAVVIYDGANYTGESIQIRHDMPSLGSMNGKLSSFQITPGYVVRFFTGDNYQGRYYTRDHRDGNDEAYARGWDNRINSVRILKTPNVSQYRGESYYEINLDNTLPSKLPAQSIEALQIEALVKPNQVNLDKNMYIEEGRFFNKTSLVINKFFVKNGKIAFIELDQPIPAYSSAYLGEQWQEAKLINMTQLGNNQMDFGALYAPESADTTPPSLRRFNAVERDSAERVQRYERFWINAPSTLRSIIDHVASNCETAVHYTECRNYPYPPERYATTMFFAQSVSGVNSNMWAKSSVWGMASGVGKELVNSTRPKSANIWMNPRLMANMLSSTPKTAIDAEQGLIHEYYHNIGFSHNSGWPSYSGIDDLFGNIAYNVYRNTIADRYVISNLAFLSKKLDATTFEFEVYSYDTAATLTLRLLSTQALDAEIFQSATNKFAVRFAQIPETDVYVSLYSENSEQMASTALDIVTSISGKAALTALNEDFETIVNTYSKVHVYTANGAWIRDFTLPATAPNGSTVIFTSNASYYSNIFDGIETHRLNNKDILSFKRKNGAWILE